MFLPLLLLCLSEVFSQDISGNLIDNPRCLIPNLKSFHNGARKFFRKLEYYPCRNLDLLTNVTKSLDKTSATLNVRTDLIPQYVRGGKLSCCVSRRINKTFVFSDCVYFEGSVSFRDVILVKCMEGDKIVYENIHAAFSKDTIEVAKDGFNILLLVLDSVSRLSFNRAMPLTNNFCRNNGFIEMLGYNKVGEKTLPNFLALLTGAVDEINCTASLVLDQCHFIWEDFSKFGYKTTFVEDVRTTFSFYFEHEDLVDPLVEYNLVPYMVLSKKKLNPDDPSIYCSGGETSGERIFNLVQDFAETFDNYFGVFWMNGFSHENFNDITRMDEKFSQFLTKLDLERNIVILASDHGYADDGDMHSWLEVNLPLNVISVPRKFKQRFPKFYENLVINRRRLTSTFDVYLTLQHILSLGEPQYRVKASKACPKCRSIFEEIPKERTCEDAGIPKDFCSCNRPFSREDLVNISYSA